MVLSKSNILLKPLKLEMIKKKKSYTSTGHTYFDVWC